MSEKHTGATEDLYTLADTAIKGHWHRTLELPCGYQHFNWYRRGLNTFNLQDSSGALRVYLDSPQYLTGLQELDEDLYLYTQHEIFHRDGVLKHTRTSPNWEGGLVSYSTCKHLMRTYDKETWVGTWLAGLCPRDCEQNCLLFAGKVKYQFASNYELGLWLSMNAPHAHRVKQADTNPRGDVYSPDPTVLRVLTTSQRPLSMVSYTLFHESCTLVHETRVAISSYVQDLYQNRPALVYSHGNYLAPTNHTRSVEMYKKSPGSKSERKDGKIPKWWRDIEYTQRGRRPPSFILSPCYLFSQPLLWTSYRPGRAVLKLTVGDLVASLQTSPP